MARTARKKSISGFYHVMVRGIGKQVLFEEDNDYMRFLSTMKRYIDEHEIRIYAYCLMENHVHILLCDPCDDMDVFMKKLEGSYAFYFNRKYERVGTLFQERYKSEAIDDNAYLLVVLRYILQNPKKAGINTIEGYPWSSYAKTFTALEGNEIIDDSFGEMFGSKKRLHKFILEPNDDKCMEPSPGAINDRMARKIICDQLNIKSGIELQSCDKVKRDEALRVLKACGLSIRQIERLTGINRGVVLKA